MIPLQEKLSVIIDNQSGYLSLIYKQVPLK